MSYEREQKLKKKKKIEHKNWIDDVVKEIAHSRAMCGSVNPEYLIKTLAALELALGIMDSGSIEECQAVAYIIRYGDFRK